MIICRSIQVAANGIILFFFMAELYIHTHTHTHTYTGVYLMKPTLITLLGQAGKGETRVHEAGKLSTLEEQA